MTDRTQAAAAEIAALINSRPISPRQDEIEAILARFMPENIEAQPVGSTSPVGPSRLMQLREMIAELEAAIDEAGPPEEMSKANFDKIESLYGPLDTLTRAIWSTPVRSPVDLKERAVIVRHWNREADCIGPDGAPCGERVWQHPDDIDDWGKRAIAHLIHAVQNFGGGRHHG